MQLSMHLPVDFLQPSPALCGLRLPPMAPPSHGLSFTAWLRTASDGGPEERRKVGIHKFLSFAKLTVVVPRFGT